MTPTRHADAEPPRRRTGWRRLVSLCLPLAFVLTLRAEYTPATLMAESRTAHANLKSYSLQIWTRSFRWQNDEINELQTSVVKVVRSAPNVIGMAAVQRRGKPKTNTQDISYVSPYRVALHVDPGPRYLINTWDRQRGRWSERPVSAAAYRDTFGTQLGYVLPQPHLFGPTLFVRAVSSDSHHDYSDRTSRIVGRENIAGHECIRLETEDQTLWFDAQTLLLRRIVTQETERGYASRVIDAYFELRPLAANDSIEQSSIADEKFEDSIMQWVPFIPFEQLLDNLRITGRAAGLLIARPEDQPLGQPALPPLSPEQRAAIVTIEGDALSGLGFYANRNGTDFLVTDAQLVTKNRWLKIRDSQGRKIECIEAFQAENARVAVLRSATAPGRLALPTSKSQGLKTYLLCAFDTKADAMRAAFCVNRPHPSGDYEVTLAANDCLSGGPIVDTADGTVIGVLIESDFGQPKRPGTLVPGWHAEPVFSHARWFPIGLVPMR